MKVCILDYGSGNTGSVYNMFRTLQEAVVVSNAPADIDAASHLVLPGVGAFGAAMKKISEHVDLTALKKMVFERRIPFLGICVGMQVLADEGQEHSVHQGLGWIPGLVKRVEAGTLSLPHVGWNNFTRVREDHPLMHGIKPETDFYYTHSYAFNCRDPEQSIAACEYGQEFTAVIGKDNIYGVQFHPEKSQYAGLKILDNFLRISP